MKIDFDFWHEQNRELYVFACIFQIIRKFNFDQNVSNHLVAFTWRTDVDNTI